MPAYLSLDVIINLHVHILFIKIFTQTVQNLLLVLVLFNNLEYQEYEICAQWKVSLLELTSCPFYPGISSRGVDPDCPDGVWFSILMKLDRCGTCIHLVFIKSRIAPSGILVITGIVTDVVTSHDAFKLHNLFLFIIMEYPGQDSIFLFPLRRIVRNKNTSL